MYKSNEMASLIPEAVWTVVLVGFCKLGQFNHANSQGYAYKYVMRQIIVFLFLSLKNNKID